MDETREVTVERLQESLERLRQEEAERRRLEEIGDAMLRGGFDAAAVGGAGLEGLLGLLDFERGVIFLVHPEGRAARDLELADLESLVTRARSGGSAQEGWAELRNAEFAVNRPVIKRALSSGKPCVSNDCFVDPGLRGPEGQRAVLCLPFDLTARWKGLLYLDRGLGRGELGETHERVLQGFRGICLPHLVRACLAQELESLEEVASSPGKTEAPDEDGIDDGDREMVPDEAEISSFHGIVGRHEKLQKIYSIVGKIKDSDINVCIFGESGTGKELLARAIHECSQRKDKLFVAENCGAIPENLLESELFGYVKGAFTGADEGHKGLFEMATGGTLFLDEIGDMSEGMQRKLLRVLQEGVIRPIGGKQMVKVDVRVICASNRDLKHLVQKGAFRADLYYRLNVITIELPPVRDREGDIPLLVSFFVRKICAEEGVKKRFSQSALRAMCQYSWPGNVRELSNVIRRAVLTCPRRVIARKDVLGLLSVAGAAPHSGENIEREEGDLFLRIPVRDSFNEIIEECERVVLLNSLKQSGWNKSKVTKLLKIPRQSLYNKIAKYGLERTPSGGASGGSDAQDG